MLVYAFESTQNPKVYGFTADATGANLPDQQGPWIPFKSLKMNRAKKAVSASILTQSLWAFRIADITSPKPFSRIKMPPKRQGPQPACQRRLST
jgi:hypothetical protein